MKLRILLMLLSVLGWVACAQADLLYFDAAADYSTATNPNSPWSYGYCAAVDGPAGFTAYNHTADLFGNGNLIGWCYGDSGWADPNLNKNMTASDINEYGISWAAGTLAGGGDIDGNFATMLRWTCPADGTYDINASFTGIQNHWFTANWLVSRNASMDWLAIQMGGSYGSTLSYSAPLTLAAGETLDFISHGPQHTAFAATISQVPEPSSLLLLALAGLGIALVARRR